ncbi:hypothetical protein ACIQZG_17815 [Lysinibacillus sp. NPDC096418]|uniref:hypothetical protein n=1 Tax=Lysinibacillus sp. NPDC096418 TaxID=3364138 RepID=UPI003819167E
MRVTSHTNVVTLYQSMNVTSHAKETNGSSITENNDAVTIGQEARDLFGEQSQLKEVPEEMAQIIASLFTNGGKLDYVESEKELAIRAEKQAEFEASIHHKVGTLIIPHIQTNSKLQDSLEGASQQVRDATFTTISKNFLLRDVGDMTEEQRQAMISLGIEKAQYIADNYLNGQQARDYMEAMTTIAKFAVNGVKDENGKYSFAIEKGPLNSAPDDNVNMSEILKEAYPEEWEGNRAKRQAALESKDYDALIAAFKEYDDLLKNVFKNQQHLVQQKISNYSEWKKMIENTTVPNHFSNLDKTSLSNFIENIKTANTSLSNAFLEDDLKQFQNFLTRNSI